MGPKLEIEVTATDAGVRRGVAAAKRELASLGDIAKGAFLGFVGAQLATVSVGALTNTLSSCVAEAEEAERVQADLNAVLAATGGAAGLSADEVGELADALSQVTRFDDDTIVSAESMLLTFRSIGKDVFPQATEATLDMAEKFKMDASQAAITLGKALNDPIQGVGALRRIGVQLTEQQEQQVKQFVAVNDVASAQKIILGELQSEIGGVARAIGETSAGKLERFNNAVGNLKEALGAALLPPLAAVAEQAASIVATLNAGIAAAQAQAAASPYGRAVSETTPAEGRNEYALGLLREMTAAYKEQSEARRELSADEREAIRQATMMAGMWDVTAGQQAELAAVEDERRRQIEALLAALPAEQQALYQTTMAEYDLKREQKEGARVRDIAAQRWQGLGDAMRKAGLEALHLPADNMLPAWTRSDYSAAADFAQIDEVYAYVAEQELARQVKAAQTNKAAWESYQNEARSAYQAITSDIAGLLKPTSTDDWIRQALVGTSQQFRDAWDEMARRAEDVAERGAGSPWAKLFNIPPDVMARGREAIKAYMTLVAQDIRESPTVEKIGQTGIDALVADYKAELQAQAGKQQLLLTVFQQAEQDPEIRRLQEQLGIDATKAIQHGMSMAGQGTPLQAIKDDLNDANLKLSDFAKTWLGLTDKNLRLNIDVSGAPYGSYYLGGVGGAGVQTQTIHEYNLAIQTQSPVEPIVQDFNMMRSLAGTW